MLLVFFSYDLLVKLVFYSVIIIGKAKREPTRNAELRSAPSFPPAFSPPGRLHVLGYSMADDAGVTYHTYATISTLLPFILYFGGFVLWWGLRGRLWYRSTRHRWPCFIGTVLPKLPPHDSRCCCFRATPGTRKHRAIRVAPCFPHNPCAVCARCCGFTDNELDLERHPCGIGLGCKFGE